MHAARGWGAGVARVAGLASAAPCPAAGSVPACWPLWRWRAPFFSHGTFVEPAKQRVTLVIALLALKTLELRARRDALVIFFLGFFTMISSFSTRSRC